MEDNVFGTMRANILNQGNCTETEKSTLGNQKAELDLLIIASKIREWVTEKKICLYGWKILPDARQDGIYMGTSNHSYFPRKPVLNHFNSHIPLSIPLSLQFRGSSFP